MGGGFLLYTIFVPAFLGYFLGKSIGLRGSPATKRIGQIILISGVFVVPYGILTAFLIGGGEINTLIQHFISVLRDGLSDFVVNQITASLAVILLAAFPTQQWFSQRKLKDL